MLPPLSFGPLVANFCETWINLSNFQSRKCTWKCRLQNTGYYVRASVCFDSLWHSATTWRHKTGKRNLSVIFQLLSIWDTQKHNTITTWSSSSSSSSSYDYEDDDNGANGDYDGHCCYHWHHRRHRHHSKMDNTLRGRHHGRDGVSNHQPHHFLLNRLFGYRSMKRSKLRVTGLCAGNSPGTAEFLAQMAINAISPARCRFQHSRRRLAEKLASNAENVSIWWRHHVFTSTQTHGM